MIPRLLTCAALVCALFSVRGLAQTPSQCQQNFRLDADTGRDVIIVLGVVNCFSCAVDATPGASVLWKFDNNVVTPGTPLLNEVEAVGNYLVLNNPGSAVMPGSAGRPDIVCTDQNGVTSDEFETRLNSPELAPPTFNPVTVNEDQTLELRCLNQNPSLIGRVEIRNPSGMMVATLLYSVPNVTRSFAGTYSCVAISQLNASVTTTVTTTVTVQFAPEITPANLTMPRHEVNLGSELIFTCGIVGVPKPFLQWIQNGSIVLTNDSAGVTLLGGAQGDTSFSIAISSVGGDSGGTYTCMANNTLGTDSAQYSVLILVPPAPVTDLIVTSVDEREVSLSWMTGFDGFSPITGIVIDVMPEPNSANPPIGVTNTATITNLSPFTTHTFSVAVQNIVGLSDRVNVTGRTLSLRLTAPTNINFIPQTSTIIRLTWSAPVFDAATTDEPDFYIVAFSRLNGLDPVTRNISATMNTITVDFTNLMKGTNYTVTVVAHNERGAGDVSRAFINQTLVDPPSMPTNLTVEGVGATALRVMFQAPTDDGGRPVTQYRLLVTGTTIEMTIPVTANTETYSILLRDEGLTENTTFTVLVSAANAEQGFGPSAVATGTTQSIEQPQTIFDEPTSGSETNSSAVLIWAFPGGTVDMYFVQYVLDRDGFASGLVFNETVAGNETSLFVENLLPGATYTFRVAVINNLGVSAFSILGSVTTQQPDPPVIISSHPNPVPEGTTVILNCTSVLEGASFTWMKDNANIPSGGNIEVNPTYLRIVRVTINSAGRYMCMASNANNMVSSFFDLAISPTEAPTEAGIDQNVIIIVASVGGASLLIFVIVVFIAVCCLCVMKKNRAKGNYPIKMKPVKKDRQNANWIETSTQFVPATGNQSSADVAGTPSDRLAFDYSVDLQTHSSFNTMEKQRIQATGLPPSHPVDVHGGAPGPEYEVGSPQFEYVPREDHIANGNDPTGELAQQQPVYTNATIV